MNDERLMSIILSPRVSEKTARKADMENQHVFSVAKNAKKRCFQRSLWTRRTKRADASRDASKIAHKIAAVFHVWRHLCTERHMVRQHLLRGTIATEVESVILRGSETKTQKTTFSKNTMDTPHKTSWRVTRSVGNSAGNHS